MSERPTARDAARLLYHLRRNQHRSHEQRAGAALDPQMALLRAWQSERLARTHADLLASERYGPACGFFLSDIYAPRDFSQRNQDLEQMHGLMLKFLPTRVLHSLTLAIEINTLTRELDQTLLEVLVNDLALSRTITPQAFARAYRLCDNYAERVRQIELITEVGQGIDRLTRLPLVGLSLRMARGPAHQAGWFELQDFLERGFAAFKHMRGAKTFLRTIEERERRILDRIYAGDPDPFAL